MRFARLELLKYGHFDGCDLEFPARSLDLQIVFGANEAGKSTTLAAVGDLLFGFPGRTPYDFRHDQQLLRVGAILEADGDALVCRRRKGNKGTLLDSADQAFDEGVLASLLGGYNAETFSRMFSLDHRRLRDGGRAIIEAKDDVGQAIFAAGSGLIGIAGILDELEAEAKEIWTKRAGGERRYHAAQRAYEEARGRQKQAQIRPAAWDELRKAIEELEGKLESLKEQRTALELERSGLERQRRVLPHAALYRDAAAKLASHTGAAVLPADGSDIFKKVLEAVAAADIEIRLAAERRDKLQEARDAIELDERLLDCHDEIQALRESKGGIDKSMVDLPRRRAELAAHTARMEDLLRELGWSLESAEEAAAALPQRIRLAEIRSLLEERGGIDARLTSARNAKAKHKAALETLTEDLERLPQRRDVDLLRAALKQAAALGDIDAVIANAQRETLRRGGELTAALAQLAPWQGTADALRALPIPDNQELAEAEAALRSARTAVDDAKRDLQTEADRSQDLALSRTQLLRDTGAVTLEAVQDARVTRDTLWRSIEQHLMDEEPLAEPGVTVPQFEANLRSADELADRRFEAAEHSARLLGLDEEIERNGLATDQQRQRLNEAEERYRSVTASWTKKVEPLGLILDPKGFGIWLERRNRSLDAADEQSRAQALAEEVLRRRDESSTRLVSEMRSLGQDIAADAAFRTVYDAANLLAEAEQKTALERQQIASKAKAAGDEMKSACAMLGEAETELSAWNTRWETAVRAASLDPTQSHATIRVQLELLDELRNEIDEVRSLAQRVDGMAGDIATFAEQVHSAAHACGLEEDGRSAADILSQLASVAADAKTAIVRQADLDEQGTEAQRQVEEARADRERALARLEPLFGAAGTTEREALLEAIRCSDTVRGLEADLERLRTEILKAGGGPALEPLLSECEKADAALIDTRCHEIEDQIGSLSNEIASCTAELATTKADFHRLDVGPDAALAAADAELARSEMTDQAEAYVRKRAEVALLRWAIAEYRSSKQAPLLLRASELFSRLTLGRFKRLLVDFDSESSRLAGLARDDSVVPVAGMSEGTVDQLFLALRLAAVEDAVAAGARLPFLADDLFINYDDDRAQAGFEVLAELARSTQVLFFTHHQHLVSVAERALAPIPISRCSLG